MGINKKTKKQKGKKIIRRKYKRKKESIVRAVSHTLAMSSFS